MKSKKNKVKKNNTIKNKLLDKLPELININGIYLLLLQQNKSESIKMQCTIFGGNYLEDKNNYGIAHLLEHLLMSSSQYCKKEICDIYLSKYGIKSNASTHDMYTNYWVMGLPEYEKILLNFITSIILYPKITQKILDREKEAVKHELEGILNDPNSDFINQIYKRFYKPQSYKHAVDYKKQLKLLNKINMKDINNYLMLTRVKKCLMFTITGKFNRDNIINAFKKLNIPNSDNKCKFNLVKNLSQCFTFSNKILYVKNSKTTSTNIIISYPIDIKIGNKYGLYLTFLKNILSNGLSSILLKKLRLEMNLVYGVSIEYTTNLCGTILQIQTSTDNNNVKIVIDEIFRLIDYYIKQTIPKFKIEREKINYKLYLLNLCKTSPTVASVFYKYQYFWQLHKKNKKIYTFSQVAKNVMDLDQKKIKILMEKVFDKSKCLIAYTGKKKIY